MQPIDSRCLGSIRAWGGRGRRGWGEHSKHVKHENGWTLVVVTARGPHGDNQKLLSGRPKAPKLEPIWGRVALFWSHLVPNSLFSCSSAYPLRYPRFPELFHIACCSLFSPRPYLRLQARYNNPCVFRRSGCSGQKLKYEFVGGG